MKHKWEQTIEGPTVRRCRLCGVTQRRRSVYKWRRVAGYKWSPLAGRCKGKPAGKPLIEVLGEA